jgi:hypothetical protein
MGRAISEAEFLAQYILAKYNELAPSYAVHTIEDLNAYYLLVDLSLRLLPIVHNESPVEVVSTARRPAL